MAQISQGGAPLRALIFDPAPFPGTDLRPLTAVPRQSGPPIVDRVTSDPMQPAGAHDVDVGRSPRRRRRPWAYGALSALLVLALGLAGYLWMTTRAYEQRAAWAVQQARAIGTVLTTTRADLHDTTTELEGVRAQLDTAETRITALANEKAQVGDDREAQRQLVDYQQRVSQAAGTVASALDRCVKGQDQLIAYVKNAGAYPADQLTKFETDVDGLCASATHANQTLQDELSK
jgi:hypothetical protein